MPSLKSIKTSLAIITKLLEEKGPGVWSQGALQETLLSEEEWTTGNRATDQNIFSYLIQEGVLHIVNISSPKMNTTRYALASAIPEEIVLSLRPNSYLSHYTAMYYHGITNSIPKIIYSNLEQFKALPGKRETLEQINIDKAFSKAMRVSNNVARFELEGKNYEGILLNGNKSDNLGVIQIKTGKRHIHTTDIEKTLIDAAVRPLYCGGASEVLEAYKMSKKLISVDTVLSYLEKLDFTYPYEQVIAFYLEKAGFSEKQLKKFEKRISGFDFYLTYEMRRKSYSQRWKLYYPAELE
jgi:predicted transcriptional regulator of viral defense system